MMHNATQAEAHHDHSKKTWPHTEVATHLDEILQLAANGEPQQITRADGTTFVIQTQPTPNEKPFINGLSIYANFPSDTELVIEREKDTPRDIAPMNVPTLNVWSD